MEGRTRRTAGQSSSERSIARSEHPSKQKQHRQHQQIGRKVSVVYYLSRNHQLEHPHFVEVPVSSPEGLYLRDVINRLIVLRGKRMPAMYSWACKRSYKNGFVWHDLAEDDLITPVYGNEYVLKGSELLDQSASDRFNHDIDTSVPIHIHQEVSRCYRTREASSSPSFPTIAAKPYPPPPQEYKISPPESSGNISPEPTIRSHPSPVSGSQGLLEYSVHKAYGWADASTQTEDRRGRRAYASNSHTVGVSTNDEPSDLKFTEGRSDRYSCFNEGPKKGRDEISQLPMLSNASPPGGKKDTLESLIRADASRMNSFRILEEAMVPIKTKLKATDTLLQLITCGSISVKGQYNFGLIPTYNPSSCRMNFSSPMFSSSKVLEELDFRPESPKVTRLRPAQKKYFSGSMIETKQHKEDVGEGFPTFKRSSSYIEDRSSKSPDLEKNDQNLESSARCLPQAIKVTSCKQSSNETMMPSILGVRNSSARSDCSKTATLNSSKSGNKMIDNASSVKGSSMRLKSFDEEKEEVIKIAKSLLLELGL